MKRAHSTLVLALLLAGCANPAPSVTPVSIAAPRSPSGADAWQAVELPNGDRASPTSVAATAHEMVIVGGRDMGPVAWASQDGGRWSFEQLAPQDAFPTGAVAFGDRVLAVGGTQTNRCAHPYATVFWVRDNNGRWANAPFDKLFCAGGGSAVAVSRGRVAMLGSGTADVPFSWFSDDGLTWRAHPIRQDVYPAMLAPVGDGFAALGKVVDDGWWFGRTDGLGPWVIRPFDRPAADALPIGLVDTGRGFIAWFVDSAGEAGAFTSETGAAWQPVKLEGLSGVLIEHVVRTPAGYAALATMIDTSPRLLVSPDGRSWRGLAGPADTGRGAYTGLAFSGDRAIVLGFTRNTGEGTPEAWTAPASLFEH